MIVTLHITVKLLASEGLKRRLFIEVLPLDPIGYITSMYPRHMNFAPQDLVVCVGS